MAFGDLLDTLALTAVMPDSFMVKLQRLAADVLTFEPGSPRAGAHPLDDQATFEFRDGSDDGPAQRTGGVGIFPVAYVLDVEAVQLVQHI
jgi:hypothetical protein